MLLELSVASCGLAPAVAAVLRRVAALGSFDEATADALAADVEGHVAAAGSDPVRLWLRLESAPVSLVVDASLPPGPSRRASVLPTRRVALEGCAALRWTAFPNGW